MSDKIDYVKWRAAVRSRVFGLFAVPLLVLCLGVTPGAADQDCACDADGNGSVIVSEMVGAVLNALDGCDVVPGCNGDANCDGTVSVSELIQGVNNLLDGCTEAASDTVVSVRWLRQRLDDPDVQIVDGRAGAFDEAHIPGALPLSPYLLAATVDEIPAQVVSPSAAQAVLSEVGLRNGTTVVVYGASPEFDPTRVVWALRYFGHGDVRYLDGGFAAWQGSGAPVDAGPATNDPGAYTVGEVVEELRVTGEWILQNLGPEPYESSVIQVVDARSMVEFIAGHIPTAISVDWARTLDANGLLLPDEELRALFVDLDPEMTTVVYCTAGWRASVDWLVLTQLGFADVRVYDGSWLEWGVDGAGFPIETGSDFEASEATATCRIENKGGPAGRPQLIRVFLTVTNGTGRTIVDVVPEELDISGSGTVDIGISAPSLQTMPPDSVIALDWAFDLEGTVDVSAAASGVAPSGQRFVIGPVDCGTAVAD